MRIAFLADSAISSTRPIWTYRLFATPSASSALTVPSSASGTARMTAAGVTQLSYWPARTKKTSSIASAKMKYVELPTSFSWYDIAVHS